MISNNFFYALLLTLPAYLTMAQASKYSGRVISPDEFCNHNKGYLYGMEPVGAYVVNNVCSPVWGDSDQLVSTVAVSYDGTKRLLQSTSQSGELKFWHVGFDSNDTVAIDLCRILHSSGVKGCSVIVSAVDANRSFDHFLAELLDGEQIIHVAFSISPNDIPKVYVNNYTESRLFEIPTVGFGMLPWLNKTRYFYSLNSDTIVGGAKWQRSIAIEEFWDGSTDTVLCVLDTVRHTMCLVDDSIAIHGTEKNNRLQYQKLNRVSGQTFDKRKLLSINKQSVVRPIYDSVAYKNYDYSYISIDAYSDSMHIISSKGHHVMLKSKFTCGIESAGQTYINGDTLHYTVKLRNNETNTLGSCEYRIRLDDCTNFSCTLNSNNIRLMQFTTARSLVSRYHDIYKSTNFSADGPTSITLYKLE